MQNDRTPHPGLSNERYWQVTGEIREELRRERWDRLERQFVAGGLQADPQGQGGAAGLLGLLGRQT